MRRKNPAVIASASAAVVGKGTAKYDIEISKQRTA